MLAQQLFNGLILGGLYALLAVGFSLIVGILKMITFAHGEVFMAGAFAGLAALGLFSPGVALAAALPAAAGGAAILGAVTELVAFRPFRRGPEMTPALITIGFSIILQALALMLAGADTKPFPFNPDFGRWTAGGVVFSGLELGIAGLALAILAGLGLVIARTDWGLALRATAAHFQAAQLMGINTDRVVLSAFVLASGMAGIGGILFGAHYGAFYPLMGVVISMKALAAATLGGIGNVGGAVVGALLLGLIESLVVGYVSANYRDVIAFSILILVILIRPAGILGRREEEKV
ncbi:MAG: branched-chain amino acid ABC transporter permease [Planctomycetota bacterium]|jgi:branched-chain amino acid transport system permease protein|nr:branched-chain amino acid ABC transporter permease [Planctomycetota bacterium]